MISYENFDLRIRSDGDRFVVSAQRGAQVATEPFEIDRTIPWDLWKLECAPAEVTSQRGTALFDALIHGRVRDLYQQGRGHAQGEAAAGLRLRLIFDPRDERLRPLIQLPWEILRDGSADGNELPALDSARPVVRMIDSVEHALTAASGPLQRVLLALANPAGSTPLHLDRELAAITDALGRISIKPEVRERTTRFSLYEAIADSDAQIVHFMGHSDLDPATGEGVLLLQDESGGEDRLPGKTFASFFTGKAAPRLVILTSCLSAVAGRQQPFAGIAFALVAAGLPAVIAMQSEIRDSNAIRFTERLYRRIAAGDAVEVAVADARKALSINRIRTLDWAAPVLFMREPPALIVHPSRDAEPARPQTVPSAHLPIMNITTGPVGQQVIAERIDAVYQHGPRKDT
jgi:hypothetical protein